MAYARVSTDVSRIAAEVRRLPAAGAVKLFPEGGEHRPGAALPVAPGFSVRKIGAKSSPTVKAGASVAQDRRRRGALALRRYARRIRAWTMPSATLNGVAPVAAA